MDEKLNNIVNIIVLILNIEFIFSVIFILKEEKEKIKFELVNGVFEVEILNEIMKDFIDILVDMLFEIVRIVKDI